MCYRKGARVKSLPEVSKLRGEKTPQKNRNEELTRSLVEELLAEKRCFVYKRCTEDAVAAKVRVNKQCKQLSARMTEFDNEIVKSKEAAADLFSR